MEAVARIEPDFITHEDPIDGLDRATGLMTAASAEVLRRVAECDNKKVWRTYGATSMAAWLAGRYGLGFGTAREWVRVAHALSTLPRIRDAYMKGRLSWDQLQPLTRFVTPESERMWIARAPELRPATLWREARRHEKASARQAEDAHRARSLRLSWDMEKPILWIEGMLGAEQGAALESALRRVSEQVPPDPDAAAPGEARLADALVHLVSGSVSKAPSSPTLVVHAGAEVLAGEEKASGPWLSETEGGRRLATEAVRRLACDARVEWVLESRGRPVGIGRQGRVVPGHIGRMLRHRDGTCRFPGCHHKRWLNAHHVVHWARGGTTNLDNLVLLCGTHHRLVHEGGWRISGHPPGRLRFHDPGGRPRR